MMKKIKIAFMAGLLFFFATVLCNCKTMNEKDTKEVCSVLEENEKDFEEIYQGKNPTELQHKARKMKIKGAIAICKESLK